MVNSGLCLVDMPSLELINLEYLLDSLTTKRSFRLAPLEDILIEGVIARHEWLRSSTGMLIMESTKIRGRSKNGEYDR